MNNEQYNRIINQVWKEYADSHWIPPSNPNGNLISDQLFSVIPMMHNKETFINELKTNPKFANKWGLKIEERKLTFEERWDLSKKYGYRTGDAEIPSPDSIYLGVNERQELESLWNDPVVGINLPTKLLTITYKDKTTEVYE